MSQTTEEEPESNWCKTCHRLKMVGCDCGLTFAEKLAGIRVHMRNNLLPHDKELREQARRR